MKCDMERGEVMVGHEFGIMLEGPVPGLRYDEYLPERYGCIEVADELIEKLLPDFASVPCYWHIMNGLNMLKKRDVAEHSGEPPNRGLVYYGVTLIPPDSAGKMRQIIEKRLLDKSLGDYLEAGALLELLKRAERERWFVIHYGI